MKHIILWLALALGPVAHAGTQPADAGNAIREGRAALVANRPAEALRLFRDALDDAGGDRYAAASGLGHAALWLGRYRDGADAYRIALQAAPDPASREAAATGLAQALNALDYPHQALALVAPFARGRTRPTFEALRALQALGWQERSPPFLEAAPAPPRTGYLGTQWPLLVEDMHLALAPQWQARWDLSRDSDGVDGWQLATAWQSAPSRPGTGRLRWGLAAAAGQLRDDTGQLAIRQLDASVAWSPGDRQTLDLRLGRASAGSWDHPEGLLAWRLQPGDDWALDAAARHEAVATPGASRARLQFNGVELGASVRTGDHVYLLPSFNREIFNDGNHRTGASLRLRLSPSDIPGSRFALGGEWLGRGFDDASPSRGVYFNPARYRATQAGPRVVAGLSPGWRLRASLDVGRQWIDGRGAAIYAAGVSLEGRLPANGRLRLAWDRSSAASASGGGPGYWSEQASASVVFPL